ncbi:hypothetical protein RBB50_000171 [Rhinocladiella similis]
MAKGVAKIAVVICSNRKPRANPQVANFVLEAIESTYQDRWSLEPSLKVIDLAERNLPFFDEPDVPSQIHDYTKYTHAHTREWSQEVQSYDGFIFVCPQYNWGYPAVLKNAIDYLYNEWKGKPAMIVSYGGHGGGRAAGQLRQVLCGVHMTPTKKHVELAFPSRSVLLEAAYGKDLGLDGFNAKGIWGSQRKEIGDVFAEMMDLLSSNKVGKALKSAAVTFGYAKQELRKKFKKGSTTEATNGRGEWQTDE